LGSGHLSAHALSRPRAGSDVRDSSWIASGVRRPEYSSETLERLSEVREQMLFAHGNRVQLVAGVDCLDHGIVLVCDIVRSLVRSAAYPESLLGPIAADQLGLTNMREQVFIDARTWVMPSREPFAESSKVTVEDVGFLRRNSVALEDNLAIDDKRVLARGGWWIRARRSDLHRGSGRGSRTSSPPRAPPGWTSWVVLRCWLGSRERASIAIAYRASPSRVGRVVPERATNLASGRNAFWRAS
jgi:hypothetical protein